MPQHSSSTPQLHAATPCHRFTRTFMLAAWAPAPARDPKSQFIAVQLPKLQYIYGRLREGNACVAAPAGATSHFGRINPEAGEDGAARTVAAAAGGAGRAAERRVRGGRALVQAAGVDVRDDLLLARILARGVGHQPPQVCARARRHEGGAARARGRARAVRARPFGEFQAGTLGREASLGHRQHALRRVRC